MMIGQEHFIEQLNKYSLLTFPHSVLLLGDRGSGHVDICNYIGDRFGVNVYDISDSISNDFINQIYLRTDPAIYIIDINKITEKEQNTILKLLEEPNGLTYIILYGESTFNVLETIINRSYVMKMDKYSREQLEPLITSGDKEFILKLCNTPGQIEIANHTDVAALHKLCITMLEKMGSANLGNALTITNKINFKDEYDKFDLDLFIRTFNYTLLNSESPLKMDLLKILMNFKNYIWFMNDKKRYFDNFILNVWGLYRNGN